jgi:hypothetical protein
MALHRRPQLWKLCHSWYVTLPQWNASETISNSVTETKHFIYFYLGHCAILLFKTQ